MPAGVTVSGLPGRPGGSLPHCPAEQRFDDGLPADMEPGRALIDLP
jgi:hypothetical protein